MLKGSGEKNKQQEKGKESRVLPFLSRIRSLRISVSVSSLYFRIRKEIDFVCVVMWLDRLWLCCYGEFGSDLSCLCVWVRIRMEEMKGMVRFWCREAYWNLIVHVVHLCSYIFLCFLWYLIWKCMREKKGEVFFDWDWWLRSFPSFFWLPLCLSVCVLFIDLETEFASCSELQFQQNILRMFLLCNLGHKKGLKNKNENAAISAEHSWECSCCVNLDIIKKD